MVTAGVTVILLPVPTSVPLHEPSYQFQSAPVPRDPPETVSVEVPLAHTAGELAVADAGAVELVFTVTVTLAHAVLLHVPSALT